MKKVAICGGANTYKFAPFNDDSFEIWAMNDLFEILPRCNRLFEMHPFKQVERTITRHKQKNYLNELESLTMPIYMQNKNIEIPTSEEYPITEILKEFDDYFTNTVSYMIALAIHEGFEEIHLYGVNMTHDTEYGQQKPSVEYFVGIAKGKGIKVYIHPQSDLLKTYHRYGYQQEKYDKFINKCNERMKFLQAQKKQTENSIENLKMKLYRTEGAIQDLTHTIMLYK